MNKILHPLIAILIFSILTVSITQNIRRLPLQSLNNALAYLGSEELFILEEGGRFPCSEHSLRKWTHYFKRVIDLMPNLAEAHGMLGFCYAHLHRDKEAIAALRQAIAINPYFWGFYYNLGAMYLSQNNFPESLQCFQKALATPPELNAVFISSSKIYADLVRKSKHSAAGFQERLEKGYKLSLIGAQLCASRTKGNLPLRMF